MLRLVLLNLRANRQRPPLRRLAAEVSPESFLWHILPHAARTFSFCIIVLPSRMRVATAVAYLYCRMLDTFEDLPAQREEKEARLREFIERFPEDGSAPRGVPRMPLSVADNDRERTHILLVNKAAWIDALYVGLADDARRVIRDLVRRMGEGMIWSARCFEAQGGKLVDATQLSEYCLHVLGNPILFAERLQRIDVGLGPELSAERVAACRAAGESIQLANITRDIEKDHARGIFYHPDLAEAGEGEGKARVIRRVRQELLSRGIERGRSFRSFLDGVPSGRVSLARGGCLLLLLFTLAYYQQAAARAALPSWPEGERLGKARALWIWLRCILSRRYTRRYLLDLERSFEQAWQRSRSIPAVRAGVMAPSPTEGSSPSAG